MKRTILIILSWLMVIFIPLSSIGISANVVLRAPDLYQYQMNDKQVLAGKGLGKEEPLAAFIGKYMLHRESELQFQLDDEDDMSLAFSKADQKKMSGFRRILDITLIASGIMLICGILAFYLLLRGSHFVILRRRFVTSAGIYAVLVVLMLVTLFVPVIHGKIFAVVQSGLSDMDLMFYILNKGFMITSGIAIIVISLVIVATEGYIIFKNTKQRGIFW